MYPDAPATSTRIRLDCFVSWGTCANLSLVYRGNRGPLDTASGLLVALNRAVVRSRAAGRARSGGQSVLPTELPPLLSSLFSYCVSLHSPLSPSLLPPRSGRAPIQQLVPSLAVAIVSSSAEGGTRTDGRRTDERRERLVHWSSEQASQVFTASAVDHSSFSPSPSLFP